MLPEASSYEELIETFHWDVPEYYNIGVDVCDKWADSEPERLALIHKRQDGAVERYTFGDIKALSNQTAHLLQQFGVDIESFECTI